MLGVEEPQLIVVRRRRHFLTVAQGKEIVIAQNGELHIRLSRAQPHIADKDIAKSHGRASLARHDQLVGSAGLHRGEGQLPVRLSISGRGESLASQGRGYRGTRRCCANDADWLTALKHHVVTIDVAYGKMRFHIVPVLVKNCAKF